MWNNLENPWKLCFSLAWQSFKKGSIPIGAVIVDHSNNVIAKGRSQQYEKNGEAGDIYNHKLSHAELQALLKVSRYDHPMIEKYTLYTSMEPCPMCFCALAMSGIRNIEYASNDRYAGSTELNHLSKYIATKNIIIKGPYHEMQNVQLALQTTFEYKRGYSEILLNAWKKDSKIAVNYGKIMYENNILDRYINDNEDISIVYDNICNNIKISGEQAGGAEK